MTTEFIHFDEAEVEKAIQDGLEQAAQDLKANHRWTNRTGQMEASITAQDDELMIGVPYASFVDARMPYVDDLEQEVASTVEMYVAQYIEDSNT